jgi:hypothetical protein
LTQDAELQDCLLGCGGEGRRESIQFAEDSGDFGERLVDGADGRGTGGDELVGRVEDWVPGFGVQEARLMF